MREMTNTVATINLAFTEAVIFATNVGYALGLR
jgi:hypothetical protein